MLRVLGLVFAIGAGVVAFEVFRSPLVGVLTVLGMVAGGMMSNRTRGAAAILVAVAAISAGSVPQAAHANGGPFPRWYRTEIPASCKTQAVGGGVGGIGGAMGGAVTIDDYAAWWNDPAYRSCLNGAGPAWLTRCAVGATVGPSSGIFGMAMTSKSWAMYASKLADLNPVGILAVAATGCVLAQIRTG